MAHKQFAGGLVRAVASCCCRRRCRWDHPRTCPCRCCCPCLFVRFLLLLFLGHLLTRQCPCCWKKNKDWWCWRLLPQQRMAVVPTMAALVLLRHICPILLLLLVTTLPPVRWDRRQTNWVLVVVLVHDNDLFYGNGCEWEPNNGVVHSPWHPERRIETPDTTMTMTTNPLFLLLAIRYQTTKAYTLWKARFPTSIPRERKMKMMVKLLVLKKNHWRLQTTEMLLWLSGLVMIRLRLLVPVVGAVAVAATRRAAILDSEYSHIISNPTVDQCRPRPILLDPNICLPWWTVALSCGSC